MPRKFQKLTATHMRQLAPGQSIFEHGLQYKKLQNGDGSWYSKIRVHGRAIRQCLGKESDGWTLTRAEQALNRLLCKAQDGQLHLAPERKWSFRRAATEYLNRLEASGGKNLEAKRQHLRDHLVPFFGDLLLTKLSGFDAERYRKNRLSQNRLRGNRDPIKPATANRELQTFRHLMHRAEEWGWIDRAPKIRLPKENNARTEYLTPEEVQRVFQTAKADANPYIYLFIRIGVETGMRRGEILSIRVENINLQNQTVFIPKAKAGARYAYMTPALAQVLQKHLAGLPYEEGFLFPAQSRTGHWVEPKKPFDRVIQNANIKGKKVTAHILRHSFASLLMQTQTEITAVATLTGHKSIDMVQRYAHQDAPWLKQAMARLGNYLETGQPQAVMG